MPDQKNTETSNQGHPSRSGNGSSGRFEKGAYTGEPLQTVQQIPLLTQVNVPVRTNQSSSEKK
jgi:hypothetical protein